MGEKQINQRQTTIKQLQTKTFDLLVIGGGITGAGISLDASHRGMDVGLIEMQDFAAGTSSRSTKLVHGGLRYLKQFEVGLVAEVGKERAIVYENGPHITTPEWMMLPFYKGGTFGPLSTNIGLRVYDFLAGVKKAERRKMLSKTEALKKEPLLQPDQLKGAGYYVEYKTDDARLTMEVLKKSVELGTQAINYTEVTDLVYENGKLVGVKVEDKLSGESYSIYAKKIINAAGPWVDKIRELDGSKQGKHLQLTKGTHLVFDQSIFPLQQAIYFDTHDKRMIFAIPRDGKTYVGTTDTVYQDEISHPKVTKADETYLLKAINGMFPSLDLMEASIESSWVGVRPLISEGEDKSPSEISRKDEIFISDSGLISMAGGKLTGYRKMAEEAVDKVTELMKKENHILFTKKSTKEVRLSGGLPGGSKAFKNLLEEKTQVGIQLGLNETQARALVQRYGTNVTYILDLIEKDASPDDMDSVTYAMLSYGLEHEFVQTPLDFFIRRTSGIFFDINWVRDYREAVVNYMATYFNWSNEVKEKYTEEVDQAIDEAALKFI